MDCVVAPVDQRLPVGEEEVSVMVPPPHRSAAGPVIVGMRVAEATATTAGAEVAEQPLAFVTVSVYVPATDTVIDCVVAPVDQRLPVAEDEVKVIAVPSQESKAGPLMVGVATAGFTVTMKGAEVAWQPPALVTVTLYEPAAATVMD
jgi:hypothetical protein